MKFGGGQNRSTFVPTLLGDHIYSSAYREGSASEGARTDFAQSIHDWLESG